MDLLIVSGVSKQQAGEFVVNDVSFNLPLFKKIAIAGETGSGKSTLLKMIAGLIQPDKGEVTFEGERVLGPEEKLLPGHPRIAYLSQHFELRNNYRVEELLEMANKIPDDEASMIFEVCQINHLLKRKTDQLSGGEKQRIAIARLLVTSPRLLLLDEPYSNLDIIHKNTLKSVIADITDLLKTSIILISHDPADTLSWADELLVMKEGKIVQQGTPERIYKQPVDEYVAGLFGTYNLIKPGVFLSTKDIDLFNKDKQLFIRPESLSIINKGTIGQKGVIKEILFLGSSYELKLIINDQKVTVRTLTNNYKAGDEIIVSLNNSNYYFI